MLAEGLVGTKIQAREQICFGACWMGPNIVIHPQGTWYCGVGTADVGDILCHIKGGVPVERLIDASDPSLQTQVIETLKSAIGRS
jgi:NADH-quinone oxidoreductase subunit F/NADP-reducing hydrogenase subunit HndC